MPIREQDLAFPGADPNVGEKKFGRLFEALDDLKPGEVYIATGGSYTYALFGGLMTGRATHLMAAGAVLNGYVRDADNIEARKFPCFSRGLYAQDQGSRGKLVDYRCSIRIGDVKIEPGDLVFGDRESVLIIPRAVEVEVVERALEKASTENQVESAIREGMSAQEAFSKFGVF